MVNNNQITEAAGAPPQLNDDWWMAILESVEERFKSNPKQPPPVPVTFEETPEPHDPEPDLQNQDWERANDLYRQDQAIDLKVTGYNRGGILVEVDNLKGFVPISHLVRVSGKCEEENEIQEILEDYVGKKVHLKVIESEPGRGRVVFSERAAQADTGRRIQLLENLREGDCLQGQITTIAKFGAFVDLGGMEGLIHISELSWGRVQHPEDVCSTGDQVEVTVLEIDRQRARIALSLKRLMPNPWETIASQYRPGHTADATITSIVSYGVFARLDSGIDGLIHASALKINGKNINQPEKILNKGQRVRVCILNIDPNRQRLGLKLEQTYE
ncbi:MAG TPA: 30S ribosomal protein S1 [Chloroflexi bacterium]|nr:30S ribosomal protein S1 [Chloroflexota bacterium]